MSVTERCDEYQRMGYEDMATFEVWAATRQRASLTAAAPTRHRGHSDPGPTGRTSGDWRQDTTRWG